MEMMALLYSRVVFLSVLIIFICGQIDSADAANDYISWEDFEVDEFRLAFSVGSDDRIIVVDQNGGGQYTTVQQAVDKVPEHNTQRVKIFIKPGIYREKVYVPMTKPYVSFIGNRNKAERPTITWNSKSSDKTPEGKELGTYNSSTVGVDGDYFCAAGIIFENSVMSSAGAKGAQAVALRVNSPRALFYDVKFVGAQDTLFDNVGHHYFSMCHIVGKVDFICGNAKSLYRNCILESISEDSGAIAAHHRDSPTEDTGFSFVDCKIIGTGKLFLGRPWGNYSRIIYSNCRMANMINPEGWSDWGKSNTHDTAVFAEHDCRGPGANRRHRVSWSKSFDFVQAKPFLDKSFVDEHFYWLRL